MPKQTSGLRIKVIHYPKWNVDYGEKNILTVCWIFFPEKCYTNKVCLIDWCNISQYPIILSMNILKNEIKHVSVNFLHVFRDTKEKL